LVRHIAQFQVLNVLDVVDAQAGLNDAATAEVDRIDGVDKVNTRLGLWRHFPAAHG
jgi:hypothetical protein